MTGIAEITSNYFYWDYTPPAVNSVRDKQLSHEAISFMLSQHHGNQLDKEMKKRGLQLSGMHIAARSELIRQWGMCPTSWRYMIGLN